MTKKHFDAAAAMVRAMRDGEWTNESPDWSPIRFDSVEVETSEHGNVSDSIMRAVWTAEAFIQLFEQFNPRFDRQRFLRACGLVE